MNQPQSLKDLFFSSGSYLITASPEKLQRLREAIQNFPHVHWINGADIVTTTQKSYAKYSKENEVKIFCKTLVEIVTGNPAPRIGLLDTYRHLLVQQFRENNQTAILVKNTHLLKHNTLELFMWDGKHYNQNYCRSRREPEDLMSVYLVAILPPDSELPTFPSHIATHINTFIPILDR